MALLENSIKPAAIPAAHDNLDKTIQSLHGLLGTLENKLQPALRLEPAKPDCSEPCPKSIAATIMGKLDASQQDVQAACNRIQELLRLLEIRWN